MPTPEVGRATLADVRSAARAAFMPSERFRIGAEVEWLVYRRDDLTAPVTASETAAAAAGILPAGGVVTVEPGGQLEVSTQPFESPDALVAAIGADAAVLVRRFADRGLALVDLGYDPIRPPLCTLDVGRYVEMDRYFRARSPAGVRMMNSTASLQLNIDFGPDPEQTWRRARSIAPVLLAAFANSPTADGSTYNDGSERQRVWDATDPCRTLFAPAETDAWARYVLDAQVMIRGGRAQTDDLTMRSWLASDDPPTPEEAEFHTTTLFPPLRPRGFLELRMIDTVPPAARSAAIATVWALLTDDEAGARAESVCTTSDLWERALASGTRDAAVDAAVDACLEIAAGTLDPVHASFVDGLRGQAAPGAMYDAGSVEGLVRGLIEPG